MSLIFRPALSPRSAGPISPAVNSSRVRARRYELVSLAVRWRGVLSVVPLELQQGLRTELFPREVELLHSVLQVEFQVPVPRLRFVLELETVRTHCSARG